MIINDYEQMVMGYGIKLTVHSMLTHGLKLPKPVTCCLIKLFRFQFRFIWIYIYKSTQNLGYVGILKQILGNCKNKTTLMCPSKYSSVSGSNF